MELLPDDFLIVWKYPKYVINGKKKLRVNHTGKIVTVTFLMVPLVL